MVDAVGAASAKDTDLAPAWAGPPLSSPQEWARSQ